MRKIEIDDLHVDCPMKKESVWMHSCYSFCDFYITGAFGSGLPGAEGKVTCSYPKGKWHNQCASQIGGGHGGRKILFEMWRYRRVWRK